MPVVLGLLLLLVVGFIAYRYFLAPAAGRDAADGATGSASDRGFGFIANGLLHYRERGGKATQLHSPYAEEAADRRERARQRHGWKQGTSFGITAGGGARSFDPGDQRVLATSAAWLPGGDL